MGILRREVALERAQEADADLVLIAPTAVPPVCRIVRLKDFYRQKVAEYRASIAGKSDLERTELSKEKTGVFIGAYAINPVNSEKIPVWIADYVLASYG